MGKHTENQLLDTVLAKAPMLGLTATIEQREVEIGDCQVDAHVHIVPWSKNSMRATFERLIRYAEMRAC